MNAPEGFAAPYQWENWKVEAAYKKKSREIARSLGVWTAARYLAIREVPFGLALEWLLGVEVGPRPQGRKGEGK
jgi:peptidoglycan/xylan/chitin deacetylase (PgdA/CDA1 family)